MPTDPELDSTRAHKGCPSKDRIKAFVVHFIPMMLYTHIINGIPINIVEM